METLWLNNGDIVQARDKGHRLAFIESENLDPLFENISNIIGLSIQPIVMEAVRNNMRSYLKRFVPPEVRERILRKELSPTEVDKGFMIMAMQMGYGGYRVVETRFEGDSEDYHTVRVSEPFSLPMCAATHCAALEAILGYDHSVSYSQVGPQTYNLVAFPFPQPRALKGRLYSQRYEPKEGDFELEKCPTCGAPKAMSACEWFFERGVIMNKPLKRRMAFVGPVELEPIFAELEAELGETIPRIVVEAQRRFTRTGFYSIQDVQSEGDFRVQLAVRGLGNLQELKINRRGLHMLVANATLPLIVGGVMQGIFEMAFDLETEVEWEVSRGNLRMELLPKSVTVSA
jgi:hypothetical protein